MPQSSFTPSLVVNSSFDAIIVADTQGIFVNVNDQRP